MSDMKEMIVDVTNNIFKDLSTKETIDKSENGEWTQSLWDVLKESELISIGVPENLGGSGGDFDDAFSIIYLAGKYAAPIPLSETIIAKRVLGELGQKAGNDPITFSFEEGNEVTVKKTNEGAVVSGKLANVPWARHAKNVVALAEMEGKSFVVQLPLEKAEIEKVNNIAGEPRDTVVFDEIAFEELALCEVDGDAFREKMLNLGALSRVVMMAGAMEMIMDLSVRYVSERKQFGRFLHRFQAVQQHLAKLTGETVISIAAMNNAIAAYEEGQFLQELAYARIRVNEAAEKVAKSAHQVHAGIGVTYEHSLHQFTRRLWAWREEFGNESIWIDKTVEHLLDNPDVGVWEAMTNTNN